MAAKKKTIETIKAEDLASDALQSRLKVLKVEEPKKRSAGTMVQSVDELIDKLRNEAKVIS
ncbi:Electron transfer flavoprotein subunit beta [compost metagenome]